MYPADHLSNGDRMTSVHTQTGIAGSGARRARDNTARIVGIYGLGLAVCLTPASPARAAQIITASPEARIPPNPSANMTELNTVEVPLRSATAGMTTENE